MFAVKSDRSGPRDFGSRPIELAGEALVADRSGALYWPAERTLIVADLHLEKGSADAARGRLLPPYDTRATLLKLADAADRYRPRVVIALGDSLHDVGGAARMAPMDRVMLRNIQAGRTWIWITGNHDPAIDAAMGGQSLPAIELRGLLLRHEPVAGCTTREIAAHLHPAAKLSVRGHTLRRPCFVGNGSRLVLPAFGAFTGGLNVLDEAFLPLFESAGFAVWMLGREGLYPVGTCHLRGD